MANLSLPARDSVAAQQELFRRANSEEGLSVAVLCKRGPFTSSTMRGWANGEAQMPAWALGALGEAGVPDHLLSLVLEPFGHNVGTDETGDDDLDEAADAAAEFTGAVMRARSPKSPGGVAIVPQERAVIIPLGRKACARIRRAAA